MPNRTSSGTNSLILNSNSFFYPDTFPYVGSKRRNLPYITFLLAKHKLLPAKTVYFFDPFAGAGNVAIFFHQVYNIIANDIFKFCYQNLLAQLHYKKQPEFKSFGGLNNVLKILNNIEPVSGIFHKEFSTYNPNPDRHFFLEETAKKIDAQRIQIRKWFNEGKIRLFQLCYLLSCMQKQLKSVSFSSGKFHRPHKNIQIKNEYKLKPLRIIPNKYKDFFVFNENALTLIEKIKGVDITYYDPPYIKSLYNRNYHIRELLAVYPNEEDLVIESGIAKFGYKDLFYSKKRFIENTRLFLSKTKTKYFIIDILEEETLTKTEWKDLLTKENIILIDQIERKINVYSTFGRNRIKSTILTMLCKKLG